MDNRPEAIAQRKLSTLIRGTSVLPNSAAGLTLQRAKKEATVAWGITHIAELQGNSLFGANALDNEVKPSAGGQLKKGDKLVIDDAPVMISRRGSNQENADKRQEDATGDKVHEWVKVLKILHSDGKETDFEDSEMYVRKETITILSGMQATGVAAKNEIELHNIADWDAEEMPDKLGGIKDKWLQQGKLRRTKSQGVIDIDNKDMEEDGKPSGRNWDQYDEGVNVAEDMAAEQHEPFEPSKRQWRIKAVEKGSDTLVGVLIVEERINEPLYLRWMIGNPEIRGGGVALLSAVKVLLRQDDTAKSIEVTSAYSAKDAYVKSGFEASGKAVKKGEEFELTLTNDVASQTPIHETYQSFKPEPYNQ